MLVLTVIRFCGGWLVLPSPCELAVSVGVFSLGLGTNDVFEMGRILGKPFGCLMGDLMDFNLRFLCFKPSQLIVGIRLPVV